MGDYPTPGTPERRELDRQLIKNPDRWPYGSLPMKLLTPGGPGWSNVEPGWRIQADDLTLVKRGLGTRRSDQQRYSSVDAMLDDGWTVDQMLIIATSRYQASELIIESGLAPVRTTLGRPRFKLPYELAGEIRSIAPHHSIFQLDGMEFERAYRHQIERHPVDYFGRQMAAIAKKAGAPGVVLLCFEDVLAGEQCHRRIFASWWEEKTGERIPELGEESRDG